MERDIAEEASPSIEQKIRRLMDRHQVTGMACGVVFDQELVWSAGFGFASLETHSIPNKDTIFRVGSVTKSITAAAILQLRDLGKLSLDSPLANYIPEFTAVKVRFGKLEDITLRRILTHHSGLMEEAPLDYWTTLNFPTMEEIIATLPRVEIVLAPDSRLKISNLGYYLLGEVIKRTSGMPYVDFVRHNILDPLGMHMSGFEVTEAMRGHMAIGYEAAPFSDYPAVATENDLRGLASAGQLYSSVADLAKWIALQIGTSEPREESPKVLSGATLEEMHRPHYMEPNWQIGLGLGWRAIRRGENIYIRAAGQIHGFISFISFIKRDRVGVLVLTNSTAHSAHEEFAWQIYDELLPRLREARLSATRAVPIPVPEHLRCFLGRYEWIGGPGCIDIVWRDGSLRLEEPDHPGRVAKLQDTEDPKVFIVDDLREVGERITFETAPNGSVIRARLAAVVLSKVLSAH